MKVLVILICCQFFANEAISQAFIYSEQNISLQPEKEASRMIALNDQLHVWVHGTEVLKQYIYDSHLKLLKVNQLVLRSKPSRLSFIQFQNFYFLFATAADTVSIFYIDRGGLITDKTKEFSGQIGMDINPVHNIAKEKNSLFLVQANAMTKKATAYSIYQIDTVLQVVHKQNLTVDYDAADKTSTIYFQPLNDSAILIKQISRQPDEYGLLLLSKLDMRTGALTHIRIPSYDSYFANSTIYPCSDGSFIVRNDLMTFKDAAAKRGTKYSYILKIKAAWSAGPALFLSSPHLEDSLKLGSGSFDNLFTHVSDNNKVLHIDNAFSAPSNKNLLRFSFIDSGLTRLQSSYMDTRNKRYFPKIFFKYKNRYLFLSDEQLAGRNHVLVHPIGDIAQAETEVALRYQFLYDVTKAIQFNENSLVIPYRYKAKLGFVKIPITALVK